MQILTSVYGKATLSKKSCAKSSPWTVFINIFRLGARCIGDIGRKLRDGLRGGREKAARRRYRSRFSWLPCWLKWEQVEQILWLKKSFFLVSHDVLALNLVSMIIFSRADICSVRQRIKCWFDSFIAYCSRCCGLWAKDSQWECENSILYPNWRFIIYLLGAWMREPIYRFRSMWRHQWRRQGATH